MSHEELAEFVNLLQRKGWEVVLRDEQSPLNLGEEVATRYPDIPDDYLAFLKYVSLAVNAERDVSFLCESDYNGSTEGPWNYFELIEIEADEEWGSGDLLSIKAFWDQHFPFMISFKGDHAYLAIDLSKDDYGAIVEGFSPDIEGIVKVSSSFSEFVKTFGDDLRNETTDLEFPDFV